MLSRASSPLSTPNTAFLHLAQYPVYMCGVCVCVVCACVCVWCGCVCGGGGCEHSEREEGMKRIMSLVPSHSINKALKFELYYKARVVHWSGQCTYHSLSYDN